VRSEEPLAYEHNGARIPRERFYEVACDPRRSVAVEACAGAGKTWMLVSRMLRALLAGSQPHEILAITFTKKAAGEMRQRLQEWLAEFHDAPAEQLQQALVQRGIGPQPASQLREALQKLYQSLLATGRPVQIRTFHSWFAALLRSAPMAVLQQLELPAHYELLEDDSEAVALVWRRFHAAIAPHAQARQDFADSVAAHGRFNTRKALEAALAKRVEFTLADQHGVVEASVQPLDSVFPEFAGLQDPCDLVRSPAVRGVLLSAAASLGRASAPTFASKGGELEQAVAGGQLERALEALLTQKGEPRKFSDKLAGIDTVRQAQELALRLAAACEQQAAWLHHQRLTRLARVLLAEFAALKRERGWIDMNDVERAALAMLSDPVLSGWVQERLDLRVRHLLIDEFQDTNPLQWQALHAWLSGYAGAGGDAPSVFIVGDPKQSIYRFRRAEPQVFRAAQAFIREGLGGDLLSCDHTHRNAPALMQAINAVMSQAQAAGEYEGFRPHTTESREAGQALRLPQILRSTHASVRPEPVEGLARNAVHPETVEGLAKASTGSARTEVASTGSAGTDLTWRDSLTTPREVPEERLVTLECRQAAAWAAAQIAAGTVPGDIMVLARKRDRLAVMEDELRALHIPAQQPEKTELGEAPEVQDIVALLDVLVSPTHDLSLARVLKSPLFGLGDDALVQLALAARQAQQQGQPRTWLELLQKAEQTAPTLSGLGAVLTRWKGWVDSLPPHDALDLVFHDGDVLARYAQAAPPPLRDAVLANLRALLGAALEVNGARYATPYAFVRALKAGGVRGPSVAASGAVQLLTVHGAKGLQAPLVLMLDTDGAPARSEAMGVIVEWPGEAPAPWRFAFIASESRPPACSADALAVEQAARQREELNALYVAMTRAQRQLVLSSIEPYRSAPGRPQGTEALSAGSEAGGPGSAAPRSWWRRLEAHCQALQAPPAAPLHETAAGAPICLPFVPLARSPRAPHAMETVAPAVSSAAALFGQAVHRLLERRDPGQPGWPEAAMPAVAREFALAPGQAQEAAAMAQRIVQGEGAWAWDPQAIDWQGNEVELLHQGEVLRLDRLVRRRGSGEWWVLDYKSLARPEQDEALLEQMRRYRQAVAKAYGGATVHAAFLTGKGRLVPVE
jgi:ATP-dependent helicase/nuclease subunit A